MPTDFIDLERRKLKATAIACRLRLDGITPEVAVVLARDTKWLRATERAAGVAKSSDATWALAMQDLARRPPVLAPDRRTGCTCTADPDTGALHEFEGWPCPHGSDDHPGPIDPAEVRVPVVAMGSREVLAVATAFEEQRAPLLGPEEVLTAATGLADDAWADL